MVVVVPRGSFLPRPSTNVLTCIIGCSQGAGCGDCWAYGATQALQDKYCIVTHKNDSVGHTPACRRPALGVTAWRHCAPRTPPCHDHRGRSFGDVGPEF